MTLSDVLVTVWREVLVESATEVEVGGVRYPVRRTRNQGLRVVSFSFGDRLVEGIEQNPNTPSEWAKLAQRGERIMQFSFKGRYVGNVCEGRLTRYMAWMGLGLPE